MKFWIKGLVMLAYLTIGTGCFSDTEVLDVNVTSRIQFSVDIPLYNHPGQVNIKEFGAKGDGKTDDTGAINRAIKSVKNGTTIFFGPGKYLISGPLEISRSSITLKGNKAQLIYNVRSGSPERLAMIKNGSQGTFKTYSPAILVKGTLQPQPIGISQIAGPDKIHLDSTAHGLEPGDVILISSPNSGKNINLTTKSGKTKNLSFYREQNFITSIKQVSGKKIILEDPITLSFKTNKIAVNRVLPVKDVLISGFDITFDKVQSKSSDTTGFQLYCTSGVTLTGCSVNSISRAAVSLLHAYKSVVKDNRLYEAVQFGSSRGFGIELNRSHFNVIKNNSISTFRHGILLNHGNGNNLIEKNTITNCFTTGAIDLHGEFNYFNTIRFNRISSSKTAIVVGGGGSAHYNDGPFNCIVENTITDCEYGIELRNNSGPVILDDNTFKQIRYKKLRLTKFDENLILDDD